ESFASDRNRTGATPLDPLVQGIRTGDPRRLPTIAHPGGQGPGGKAYRYAEGQGMVPEDLRQADPQEFPLPYMMGGPRPNVPGTGATRGQGAAQPPATRSARTPGGSPGAALEEPGTSPAEAAADNPTGQAVADPRSSGSPA